MVDPDVSSESNGSLALAREGGGKGAAGLRAASGNSVACTLRRDSDIEHALSRPMK